MLCPLREDENLGAFGRSALFVMLPDAPGLSHFRYPLIIANRVVCLTQPYSDVMTDLTFRPFRATRLVGCVPG
jgi:hypothetical protein